MTNCNLARIAALCAVGLFAVPLFASSHPNSENTRPEKKSITLDTPAQVDGKTLTPGDYEVLIEGKNVKFERDGKVAASALCEWKTLNFKAQYNSVELSAQNAVQELQFEGSNQALDVR